MAVLALAGSVAVTQPGCVPASVLVRVPWTKVFSVVLRFVKDRQVWVLILTGLNGSGQTEIKEVPVSSADMSVVTVELKDGSKQTMTPTKESL